MIQTTGTIPSQKFDVWVRSGSLFNKIWVGWVWIISKRYRNPTQPNQLTSQPNSYQKKKKKKKKKKKL